MAHFTRTKQPYERVSLSFDAGGILPAGVTLTSGSCTVFDPTGADVSSSMVVATSVASPFFKVTLEGGTAGTRYNVRIRLGFSDTQTREYDLALYVAEST